MSVKRCCVSTCKNTCADTILHLFPNPDKDLLRFNEWRNAIGGHIMSLDHQTVFNLRRVCHLHFETQYHTRSKRLSNNAVPTLHLSGVTREQPLQDITNQVTTETNINPSTSAPSPLPSVIQMSKLVPVQTKTSKIGSPISITKESLKKPSQWFSAEIIALRNKIKLLQKSKESQMIKLKKALKMAENPTFQRTMKKLSAAAKMFIALQLREAGKKKLGRRFNREEKLMALAFYKHGPRAYKWMRKFFILPSPLTLSRMISSASLKPGFNENLFHQLKRKAAKMTLHEKLCLLLFDEVALAPHIDYNRRTDNICGFVNDGYKRKLQIADHALVFMLRGVQKNYKQPISYSFCAKTTPKEELIIQIKRIIRKLYEIGFIVVGTVCDQGATNVSAINHLINETRGEYIKLNKEFKNSFFEVDSKVIIPIYDPPHLMKGIRNNLLSKHLKCVINGKEKIGKWDHILKLYDENPAYQGIRLMPKLTERHVIPSKIGKMKVKYATQVFSRSVAANMGYLARYGILPNECQETADILIFFDNLFDSMNGSYRKSKEKSAKPLLGAVTPRSPHQKLWNEAKLILKSMKYVNGKKSGVVPSIIHWLMTIENMEFMIQRLSEQYGLTSVWMRHFNQDPLENFFGCIRSHSYRNISPTCAGFEAAFASLLINNLSSNHSPGSNCEVDSCTVFKSLKTIFFKKFETSSCTVEVDFDDLNIDFVDVELKLTNIKIRAQLEYVAGYVLRVLKTKIFNNCEICKKDLYNNDKRDGNYLVMREYYENKYCLTYPNINMIKCFSNIQDVTTYIIQKDSPKINIKAYIKMILSVVMNYNFLNCIQHRTVFINKLEDISINLFLYSYCKNINKLLNGARTDCDMNDKLQAMSVNYHKKKLQYKYKL